MSLNIATHNFTTLVPAIAEYVRRDARPDIRMRVDIVEGAGRLWGVRAFWICRSEPRRIAAANRFCAINVYFQLIRLALVIAPHHTRARIFGVPASSAAGTEGL